MSFPATFNIRYYKGDLYEFVIRPKRSTGEPFPISSATHNAYFYIAPQRGGTLGQTIIAGAVIQGGNISATILPSVGSNLNPNIQYFYDVSVQGKPPNSNQLYTLLTGSLTVTPDITGPS